MPNVTLAFDKGVDGWTSEFSYLPDSGVSLNNRFYTFKHGNIYQHNVEILEEGSDTNRNTFYDNNSNDELVTTDTEIEFVLNENPSQVKNFKTLSYEGTNGWEADAQTFLDGDSETGNINSNSFIQREGKYHGYIRGNDTQFQSPDLTSGAVSGIGTVSINNPNVTSEVTAFLDSLGDPITATRFSVNSVDALADTGTQTNAYWSVNNDNLNELAPTWDDVDFIGQLETIGSSFFDGLVAGNILLLYVDNSNFATYRIASIDSNNARVTIIRSVGVPSESVSLYKGGTVILPSVLAQVQANGGRVDMTDREVAVDTGLGFRSVSRSRGVVGSENRMYYFNGTTPGDTFGTSSRDWSTFNNVGLTTEIGVDPWDDGSNGDHILFYVNDSNWGLYSVSNINDTNRFSPTLGVDLEEIGLTHISSFGLAPEIDTGMSIYFSPRSNADTTQNIFTFTDGDGTAVLRELLTDFKAVGVDQTSTSSNLFEAIVTSPDSIRLATPTGRTFSNTEVSLLINGVELENLRANSGGTDPTLPGGDLTTIILSEAQLDSIIGSGMNLGNDTSTIDYTYFTADQIQLFIGSSIPRLPDNNNILNAVSMLDPDDIPVISAEQFVFTRIPSSLAVNDLLFRVDSNAPQSQPEIVGRVNTIGNNFITRTIVLGEGAGNLTVSDPRSGDFIFSAKNTEIEKSGLYGFYNIISMKNSDTAMSELFSVESNTFISSQ